jgi:hypothetical protein
VQLNKLKTTVVKIPSGYTKRKVRIPDGETYKLVSYMDWLLYAVSALKECGDSVTVIPEYDGEIKIYEIDSLIAAFSEETVEKLKRILPVIKSMDKEVHALLEAVFIGENNGTIETSTKRF